MPGPLHGERALVVGTGPVPAAAAELLGLLGAQVVAVAGVTTDEHRARLVALDPLGAIDAGGALARPAAPGGAPSAFPPATPGGAAAKVMPFPVEPVPAAPDANRRWAASGAMALTGHPAGPALGPPGELVERLLAAGAVVRLLAAARGAAVELDPLALLGERAAIAGLGRRGTTSVGGNCHLLRSRDGWVALNLARTEDLEAIPALLDGEAAPDDWPSLVAAVAARTGDALVQRARLLGVALGRWPGPRGRRVAGPLRIDGATPGGGGDGPSAVESATNRTRGALVVDLTALWAGPLAGGLLVESGARVVKVEAPHRPDGARRGPAAFFDLLNAGKDSVALDLRRREHLACVQRLIDRADVVLESFRPRVLAELGIDPFEVVRRGRTTWVSITGHGTRGDDAMRVAFGDDAAVAGGCTVGDPPLFVADAVADPIGGLYAAAVALAALVGRRGNYVEVALADAAAYARGCTGAAPVDPPDRTEVEAPRARPWRGAAAPLGAHTAAWCEVVP